MGFRRLIKKTGRALGKVLRHVPVAGLVVDAHNNDRQERKADKAHLEATNKANDAFEIEFKQIVQATQQSYAEALANAQLKQQGQLKEAQERASEAESLLNILQNSKAPLSVATLKSFISQASPSLLDLYKQTQPMIPALLSQQSPELIAELLTLGLGSLTERTRAAPLCLLDIRACLTPEQAAQLLAVMDDSQKAQWQSLEPKPLSQPAIDALLKQRQQAFEAVIADLQVRKHQYLNQAPVQYQNLETQLNQAKTSALTELEASARAWRSDSDTRYREGLRNIGAVYDQKDKQLTQRFLLTAASIAVGMAAPGVSKALGVTSQSGTQLLKVGLQAGARWAITGNTEHAMAELCVAFIGQQFNQHVLGGQESWSFTDHYVSAGVAAFVTGAVTQGSFEAFVEQTLIAGSSQQLGQQLEHLDWVKDSQPLSAGLTHGLMALAHHQSLGESAGLALAGYSQKEFESFIEQAARAAQIPRSSIAILPELEPRTSPVGDRPVEIPRSKSRLSWQDLELSSEQRSPYSLPHTPSRTLGLFSPRDEPVVYRPSRQLRVTKQVVKELRQAYPGYQDVPNSSFSQLVAPYVSTALKASVEDQQQFVTKLQAYSEDFHPVRARPVVFPLALPLGTAAAEMALSAALATGLGFYLKDQLQQLPDTYSRWKDVVQEWRSPTHRSSAMSLSTEQIQRIRTQVDRLFPRNQPLRLYDLVQLAPAPQQALTQVPRSFKSAPSGYNTVAAETISSGRLETPRDEIKKPLIFETPRLAPVKPDNRGGYQVGPQTPQQYITPIIEPFRIGDHIHIRPRPEASLIGSQTLITTMAIPSTLYLFSNKHKSKNKTRSTDHKYHQVPSKEHIEKIFPGARKLKPLNMVEGGGKKRLRLGLSDGTEVEFDTRHGTWEWWNQGRTVHKGELSNIDGKTLLKPPNKARRSN